jgi:hypothetical protein
MSASALEAATPVLPNSAIVTNSGKNTVVLFVVRFEYRHSAGVVVRDYRSSEPKLKPSASEIVDPMGSLASYLTPRGLSTADRSYAAFLAQLDRIKNGPSIRASLDSVLYDNGQFAGPDVANTFDNLIEENVAITGLFKELRGLTGASDSQIESRLNEVAESPQKEPMATIKASRAQMRRASKADYLASILRYQGRPAFNKAVADYQEPAVWK